MVKEYAEQETSMKAELCLPPAFTLVSCSAYSSTLIMEATHSSETSVDTEQTTQRYIPEDSTLHLYVCLAMTAQVYSNNRNSWLSA
jgi:hypothetical protein